MLMQPRVVAPERYPGPVRQAAPHVIGRALRYVRGAFSSCITLVSSRAEVLGTSAKLAGPGLPGTPIYEMRFESRIAFQIGLASKTV